MTSRRTTSLSGRAALGVDLGSTRLRAAYALPDGAGRIVPTDAVDWPWPLCEPARGGELPFSFPSVKSLLGDERPVRSGGTTGTPAELVTRALRGLRERVAEETGAGIGQVVISVPAWLESARRTALLEAAHRAGLTTVRLISDSLAAVVGHTAGRESGTFLVYAMGYSGLELGLVRAAHGHFRALACEGTASCGGSLFDRDVLTAWTRFLRHHGRFSVVGDESAWRLLRVRAERVKERLAAPDGDELVELSLGEAAGGCGIGRPMFDEYMRGHVGWTLERLRALFDQSGLQPADVDGLLLAGGSTRMHQIRTRVSELGMPCVPLPDDQLARGALLHAERLSGTPQPRPDDLQVGTAVEERAGEADVPGLIALPTVHGGPAGARLAAPAPAPSPGLAEARRLIERGEHDAAAGLLHEIIVEAQALLSTVQRASAKRADTPDADARGTGTPGAGTPGAGTRRVRTAVEPPASPPSSTPPSASVVRLKRARSLLEQRRYGEAVEESHAAWAGQSGPDGPDVFEAMIEIHRAAAMAEDDPAPFQDAERWLRCAYQLDPTNTGLRELLAERTYRHAVQLDAQGRRADALAALRAVTKWDPDHAEARTMHRRLDDDGSPDIRDGPGGRTRRGYDSAK
ncbi:Hsp70 family protein [Actinomadura sp. 3N508]|uniref:Hsp70 family protein n=1 Tax=Actinomadura sp. 3N508 TaxID=3375153 RepID=UPI0037AA86FC